MTDKNTLPPAPAARVVFFSGVAGESRRFRCAHPAAMLAARDWSTAVYHLEDVPGLEVIDDSGLVILHRMPYSGYTLGLLRRAAERKIPVAYDIDEPLFSREAVNELSAGGAAAAPAESEYFSPVALPARLRTLLLLVGRLLTGTGGMREQLRELGLDAALLPDGLAEDEFALLQAAAAARPAGDGKIRLLVHTGASAHDLDFAELAEPLRWCLEKYPQVGMVAVGPRQLPAALRESFAGRMVRHACPAAEEYAKIIAATDIHLVPLRDSRGNRGRSINRYLDAAAAGLATIASPVGEYAGLTDGENVRFARSADDWRAALGELIEQPPMRARMAAAAAAWVRAERLPARLAANLLAVVEQLRSGCDPAPPERYAIPDTEVKLAQEELHYYQRRLATLAERVRIAEEESRARTAGLEHYHGLWREAQTARELQVNIAHGLEEQLRVRNAELSALQAELAAARAARDRAAQAAARHEQESAAAASATRAAREQFSRPPAATENITSFPRATTWHRLCQWVRSALPGGPRDADQR